MSTEIKIKKAKIVKDKTLELSYVKTEDDKSVTKVNEEHNAEVHRDLKRAFAGLDPHLAIINEFIKSSTVIEIEKVDAELVNDFHATGYSIGGDDGDEGIVISGRKTLSNGKAFNFNTVFTRFTATEETGYKFVDDLLKKIGIIEAEVVAYLNDGKKADDAQGSLFDDKGDPITNIQILPEESQDEKDEKVLKHLRNGAGQANAEAMGRVADMDGEDKAGVNEVIDGAVGAMVQEQREHLRGRGKGRGKNK
jgi:hypothetical protein